MKSRATSNRSPALQSLLVVAWLAMVLGPFSFTVPAQSPDSFQYWPNARYDAAIPTLEQTLGYSSGARITAHAGLRRYFDALAAAAPGRFQVIEYARSWEGRELFYGAVASPENFARLDEIRDGMSKLADARRTSSAEAKSLIARLPIVIWLGYGVHGNEISSPDAALLTAYHLLAARGDEVADRIRKSVVVLIDPIQNPDGRDRFIHHFEQSLGLEPDASPLAAEHVEPWPGGRTNHYLFDLNRDWFALTQPETRGRVAVLRDWRPAVFVDLHEMGSEATYYFAPEAVPYNPHLTADQRSALDLFGKNNSRWFDRFGFSYFTREVYDAFYPGYGASWPSYYGAVAMTYEQASARGLLMNRSDETTLHFRDGVRQHFVASISTAEVAARNREKLLGDLYEYSRTAIEEGASGEIRAYALPRRGDVSVVDKLAAVLHEQGIEIRQTEAASEACGVDLPPKSFVIPLAQPANRLIRNLLDPEVSMEEEFLKEQERRRKKNLPDEIYDVTAWSLPQMFNVEAIACKDDPNSNLATVSPPRVPEGRIHEGPAGVGYFVPWNTAAGRFLSASLRRGLRVLSSDKQFRQENRSFPRGTLILKRADNPDGFDAVVATLARQSGADVYPAASGWVDEGVNLGSGYVSSLPAPRIALAWDRPARPNSAGWTRYLLEREFNYPVTPIRTRSLAGADLSKFDVLILPDAGAYGEELNEKAVAGLKDWVSRGGVLIGLRGAVEFFAAPKVKLLEISQEDAAAPPEPKDDKEKKEEPKPAGGAGPAADKDSSRVPGTILAAEADFLKAIQPKTELPDQAAGVLVKAKLDPDHWMTAGLGETVNALYEGRGIFTPIKLDKGVNAAYFAAPDDVLVSGYLWEENRKQLAYKPLVAVQQHDRGVVIGFTADPAYRAYLDGMNLLLLNAVFRGPGHARPAPN